MGEKKQIRIAVKDKIACLVDKEQFLVCGNNDYEVVFDFDSDWEGISAKTAVFVYGNTPIHQPFEGNVCEGVEIKNATLCAIGVFAGDIKTTTGATIECRQSIRDIGGVPKPPSKEVYDEIMALLDKAIEAHTELPVGGKKGQVLKKVSDEDYDTEWANDEQRDLSEIEISLANKLDKTEEANKIYATNANGNQTTYPLADNVNSYGIALRQGGGYLSGRTPMQPWHYTIKEYTDAKDNEVKAHANSLNAALSEKQTAIEKRVSNLESLTLTYTQDKTVAYEKSVPSDVGTPAFIKEIGGATKKVVSKNILNPNTIVAFAEGSPYHPNIVHNTDGTITYTYANDEDYYDGGIAFNLADCGEVGRYHIYANDFSAIGLASGITGSEEHKIKGTVWIGLNKAVEPTTLKVMVWKDTSATTTEYEVVTASSNTVFEPYHEPYFVNAEVEKVESIGANLIPFPYREQSKTMNGVTFTVQEDGSVKVTGTATGTANFFFYMGNPTMFTVGKTYSKSEDVTISVVKTDGTTAYLYGTFEWLAEYKTVNIYMVYANTTVDKTVYPRINVGSKLASYKPYSAEPIDTFAIPVDAIKARVDGFGLDKNYIQCIDNKFEFVQKRKRAILNSKVGWWSAYPNLTSSGAYVYRITFEKKKIGYQTSICSAFENKNTSFGDGVYGQYSDHPDLSTVYFCSDKATLNEWTAWLDEKEASGNPVILEYDLATPVVTDITDLFTKDEIEIEQGGTLRFVNEHEMSVPSNIVYVTRKG